MTRTFVIGEPSDELREWHRLCKEALDKALADIRAGVTGKSVFDGTCDVFEAAGYKTQRTKEEGKPLEEGFFHSLGHGVGLEVHEEPSLGMLGQGARRRRRRQRRAGPLQAGCRRLQAGRPRARDRERLPRTSPTTRTTSSHDPSTRSRRSSPRTGAIRRRRTSPRRRMRSPTSTTALRGVLGDRGARAHLVVRAVHEALRVGARRTRSGTSAARRTSRTTASTATSRRDTATRSRTTGKASPTATGARSPSPTCSGRRRGSRTR